MGRPSITKRAVDAAEPSDKDRFLWDGEVAGFGLKVTPAGSKVYIYQYRIAPPGQAERTTAKRYTIGKHGNLTPDQARKRAKALAAMVDQGTDPRQREIDELAARSAAADRAREQVRIDEQLAFDKVAARWLEHYEVEKERSPSSVALAKLVVSRYLSPSLGQKPVPYVTRADLQPIIDAIPIHRKGIRRAVYAYSSILFGWAHKRGDIAANPLANMAKPEAPKSRDRVLSDTELAKVWKATFRVREVFGTFFRLLIVTGQRRSEVAGLSWAELDRPSASWTIPAARAKNRVTHLVPLNALAIGELDRLAGIPPDCLTPEWPKTGLVLTTTGSTPISGINKAKVALDRAIADEGQQGSSESGAALDPWRIHDLRRSLATGFQRLGVRFEVTEATLNHVSGAKGGIAGVYQRHDWKDEKRVALEAWGRHILSLSSNHAAANVVPLKQVQKSA